MGSRIQSYTPKTLGLKFAAQPRNNTIGVINLNFHKFSYPPGSSYIPTGYL
jgi:hypothetical protein